MVQKWELYIEVSCRPNLGEATIKYVLHNAARNHVLHRNIEVHGRTTNNEAYYIALVEGLKEAKNYVVNDITVFTHSQLICNQIKGIFEVRKANLKPLYKEAIMWISQFQSFSIHYHANIHKMSIDILSRGMSVVDGGVRDAIVSSSIAREVIDQHQHSSPISECVVVIIFLGAIMTWFFH